MSETDGPGLPFRPEEWEALAVKWPNLPETEKEHFNGLMTRAQRRRFERTLAEMHDGKKDFAGKLATREDVVQIVALFLERHVMPVAADVDAMARDLKEIKRWYDYQRLPWWRKVRVAVNVRWALLIEWLASRGIRIVPINDVAVYEAPAESDGADGEGDSQGEAAPAPSLIEVVAR